MNDNVLKVVAKNIVKERHKRNMSQEKLAEEAGIHRTYIGIIERCEKNPTILTVAKIADALGVDIRDLFKK